MVPLPQCRGMALSKHNRCVPTTAKDKSLFTERACFVRDDDYRCEEKILALIKSFFCVSKCAYLGQTIHFYY